MQRLGFLGLSAAYMTWKRLDMEDPDGVTFFEKGGKVNFGEAG